MAPRSYDGHLERATLDLSRVDFLVLDEADEMLTMRFADDVEAHSVRDPRPQAGRPVFATCTPDPQTQRQEMHDPFRNRQQGENRWAINAGHIQVARKMDALTRCQSAVRGDSVFVRTGRRPRVRKAACRGLRLPSR